jgi:hypothetical protein
VLNDVGLVVFDEGPPCPYPIRGDPPKLAISARKSICARHLAYFILPVDPFVPVRGKPFDGLDEFNARLDHTGAPAVSATSRPLPVE